MRPDASTVLTVHDLVVEFAIDRGQKVHAVSGMSIDLREGETVGILGESGCGKSSAGRALMQMPPPTSGSVRFDGTELTDLNTRALRRQRSRMQMIMQDPVSSLNPRRKVKDIVSEGPTIWGQHGGNTDSAVRETLEAVGLDPDAVADRRAHELSGGQCQRVCIARALMLGPRVLICDEPVSSLDVSIQAQILNLLERTKHEYGLSLLFIAHDLAVVKNISDRVMVMYLGKTCEVLPAEDMHNRAEHPYTTLLLDSIPESSAETTPAPTPAPTPARAPAPEPSTTPSTELPSPVNPPPGCRFHTRCPLATERCTREEPQLRAIGSDHYIACHNIRT